MSINAEKIKSNWETFLGYIDQYIKPPRKQQLLSFYKEFEKRIALMPASHKKAYHNAFPGDHVDHTNRVVEAALKLNEIWIEMGVDDTTYTVEELVFSALNHDLGKMGDRLNQAYLPQTDQWRRDKLGEEWVYNNKLDYMTVPERSLFLLQEAGISYTKNEMLAIRLHDGLYDPANEPYLKNYMAETKPRTSLIYILHQADLLASRIEFEKEWLPKLRGETIVENKEKKSPTKSKALGSIKSEGLSDSIKNL